ncbi:TPA: hypothetical protein ACJG01_002487 [Salmonella enterica subsp. salamae serovar 21:z10:[z6]]|nr:hypothetical protein [Salmonella enterica]ECC9704885.1 hypothetical protein [Salmonella enterica subsp. salamae]
MFNVKRNGASVEITDIPQSVPFSVFKNIADETGANECLFAYVKDKNTYEVVIHHDSVNMAGAVAWLALEAREPATRDADISTIGEHVGNMRVNQYTNTQELEDVNEMSESWYSKPTVHFVINNDEIKINGKELHDVSGGFLGISKSSDILVRFNCETLGFRRTEITIKPRLTETTLEEVLVRVGMIIGKRFIKVVDERTKSISS